MNRRLVILLICGIPCSGQDQASGLSAKLQQYNELRDQGKIDEARKGYDGICPATGIPPSSTESILAECHLNYARLIEMQATRPGLDSKTTIDAARAHYDAALTHGDEAQKALAANNGAALELSQSDVNTRRASDYLNKLSAALAALENGADPKGNGDLTSQQAVFYGNLGNGWAHLQQWQKAVGACRLALSHGATPDAVLDGALAPLKKLRSGTKVSMIADLMIGRNAGVTASNLIVRTLPSIGADYDWPLIYSPERWFKHAAPWPHVIETLLEALDAGSVSPADFQQQYWKQGLLAARSRPGLGNVKLRSSIIALGEIYGIAGDRIPNFGSVTRWKDIDARIRAADDTLAISNILLNVAEAEDQTQNSVNRPLSRYAAAWLIYPNNISAALDTAAIVKASSDPLAPKLKEELWRTYVTKRRLRWVHFFLGPFEAGHPQVDLSSRERAILYSSLGGLWNPGDTAFSHRQQRLASVVRLEATRGSAAPEMYTLLGKLDASRKLKGDAENHLRALQGYLDQNREEMAGDALQSLRKAQTGREPEVMTPGHFRPEWKSILLKVPPRAVPQVAVSPHHCDVFEKVTTTDAGLLRAEFTNPLQKCDSIIISGPFGERRLGILAEKSGIGTLWDRDEVISGKVVSDRSLISSTFVIDLTVRSNAFEPSRHLIASVDPFTGEFHVPLKKPLVAGQKVEVRALDGDKVTWSDTQPVKPLPLDAGAFRIYLSAGTAIGFSGISDVANLVAGFKIENTFLTWHKNNFLVSERGAVKSKVAGLLSTWWEARIAPLDITAHCVDRSCTRLVQPAQSGTFNFGIYAPIVPKFGTTPIRGRTNGYFIAPLVKAGVQRVVPSSAVSPVMTGRYQPFWSGGIRLGNLRFVNSETDVSSSLLSHFDLTFGRWDRFAIPTGTMESRVPTRFEASGEAKLPRTPLTVGFLANMRQGLNEYRLFVGLRIDLFEQLSRLKREVSVSNKSGTGGQ